MFAFHTLRKMEILEPILTCPLPSLDEKIGRRFGFGCVRLNADSMILVGGASYFDANLTDKPELDKFAAVPLSQLSRVTVRKSDKRDDREIVTCDLLAVNEASTTNMFPPNRCFHSAAILAPAKDPVIVIFGGRLFDNSNSLSHKRCASLFCCDLKNGVQWYEPKNNPMSPSPSPRCSHACVSINLNTLIIHGGSGVDDSALLGDLWSLHLGSDMIVWTRLTVVGAAPAPRQKHTLTAVSAREAVLFGGETADGAAPDFWLLILSDCGTKAAWIDLPSAPTPRAMHSACLVTSREISDSTEVIRRLLVFGGARSTAVFDFQTSKWAEIRADVEEAAAAQLFAIRTPQRLSEAAPVAIVFTGSPSRAGHRVWMYALAGFDPRDVKTELESQSLRENEYSEFAVNKDEPKQMEIEKVKIGDFFWPPSALFFCLEILGGKNFKHRKSGEIHFFDFPTQIDFDQINEILNGENSVAPYLSACAAKYLFFASKDANGALTLAFMSHRLWLDAHSKKSLRVPVARFTRGCPELLAFLRLVRVYAPLTEAATAAALAGLKRGNSVAISGGFTPSPQLKGLEILTHGSTVQDMLPLFDFEATKAALYSHDFKKLQVPEVGQIIVGKLKENFGVLVYSHGRLIRRLSSRLPGVAARGKISAIVDAVGLIPDAVRTVSRKFRKSAT